jgi:hypothetical protein
VKKGGEEKKYREREAREKERRGFRRPVNRTCADNFM